MILHYCRQLESQPYRILSRPMSGSSISGFASSKEDSVGASTSVDIVELSASYKLHVEDFNITNAKFNTKISGSWDLRHKRRGSE